jgi:hypothetical protein
MADEMGTDWWIDGMIFINVANEFLIIMEHETSLYSQNTATGSCP